MEVLTSNPALDSRPKVSIVVPTFNRESLLRETIDSILAQTFSNYEIIIVDNMSQDGTGTYVASLTDDRIRYFRNPNQGVIATSRNFGIANAQGIYIAFCDDDDLWGEAKLHQQIEIMESDNSCALCYSNALSFEGEKVISPMMVKRRYFSRIGLHLLRGNLIPTSSVLVRKCIIQSLGGFDQSRNLIGAEDYELWLRISSENNITYIDEPLVKYRIHANHSSTLSNQARLNIAALTLARKKKQLPHNLYYIPLLYQVIRKLYYTIRKK
ncbi:MAG: glycosyltransferase [Rhodocyclaceae bacterium]|nr:glycosyltransferase [Rhodocyclaceae bacterium]